MGDKVRVRGTVTFPSNRKYIGRPGTIITIEKHKLDGGEITYTHFIRLNGKNKTEIWLGEKHLEKINE